MIVRSIPYQPVQIVVVCDDTCPVLEYGCPFMLRLVPSFRDSAPQDVFIPVHNKHFGVFFMAHICEYGAVR